MFKIKIIALGKFKEQAYRDLGEEFLKRLSLFAKIKVVELPEVSYGKNPDLERVKEQEAASIVKQLTDDAVVILLEEKGTLRDSPEFAKFLERIGGAGREIIFVLGSGIGLHKSLQQYSNYVISLSTLTFPHNLARLILLEQLYRAVTILTGKSYHK